MQRSVAVRLKKVSFHYTSSCLIFKRFLRREAQDTDFSREWKSDIIDENHDFYCDIYGIHLSYYDYEADELETKVDSLTDLSPEVVSSTSAMTDHSKIYLNTSNGYWYYYNGTQFVQGGLYNSDATDTAIKWYLNDVATDGNNVHNPFTSVVGGLASADGSYISSSTTTWVTDFIEINPSNICIAKWT